MCRFTEVICITEGKPNRIEYHNRRCNATRRRFFPGRGEMDLRQVLREAGYTAGGALPSAALNGTVGKQKCRVEYDEEIRGITVIPYTPRVIKRLRLVYDDTVDYGYKYADREQLQRLARRGGDADAVIIVKNGHLTDTTFSNIALFDGESWIVPDTCLLPGTMRQYLLDSERVRKAAVTPADLDRYETISLINAMLDLGETVLPVSSVLR